MQLVRFKGATGGTLTGWFHTAPAPRGALILAHCFTCSKNLRLYRDLALSLGGAGLSLLRFDFTGVGQSDGSFAETTLRTNIDDLRCAVQEVEARAPGLALGMIGHSLGGVAVLLAARELPQVRALAALAAPCDPHSLEQQLGRAVTEAARSQGVARAVIAGRSVSISRELLDSIHGTGLLERLGELRRPVLFLHGTEDAIVRIGDSERLFAAAAQPKAFEPIVGGDHLLSDAGATEHAARVLSVWFQRHLAGS